MLHPGIAVDFGILFRSPPLDASIKNYDSLYHVLSTNVKTERTTAPHEDDKGSGLSGPEEELHRTAHALAQLVRSREIHSPLTDDGVKKSLHEFREVHNR